MLSHFSLLAIRAPKKYTVASDHSELFCTMLNRLQIQSDARFVLVWGILLDICKLFVSYLEVIQTPESYHLISGHFDESKYFRSNIQVRVRESYSKVELLLR